MKNCLPIFFMLLSTASVYAQADSMLFRSPATELLTLKPQQHNEVSIGSNVVAALDKQPVSVATINKHQLKLSGARTLSEALLIFIPGYFSVEDQDDIISGFRGLAPDNNSKVLLLINGQNLNTEFFWGPPDAVLHSPNMEYIERIEVIRGSGSVTLGQGALLGVINIVTKNANPQESVSVQITNSAGLDNYVSGGLDIGLNAKGLKLYSHLSALHYGGQALRNEGWVNQQNNQGIAGGKVIDMGHRLHRTDNVTFINRIEYKNFFFNLSNITQKRDLYNFYRDREVLKQNLLSVSLGGDFTFSPNISNKTTLSTIIDNYYLSSLTGANMGGTAENRYGIKTLFNLQDSKQKHKLALGSELRLFQMGNKNNNGNNFIANQIGAFNPATANENLTMGYNKDILLFSVFAEYFYSLNEKIDIFGAFRFDQHPFWGKNLSPRLGFLYAPTDKILIRVSYQSGFRGAVGLHYSGGYKSDGFLRATNYAAVENANIQQEKNINPIIPERINNTEVAVRWKITEKLVFNGVLFYNVVKNVIDVGVIYRDPAQFKMVNIGSDVPGDWNGYWFFKNTPGAFEQIGGEFALQYTSEKYSLQVTNAVVKVLSATSEQTELAVAQNSMYLAVKDKNSQELHHKAFPEMVTRLNLLANPIAKLNVSLNVLYYSKWYSPAGTSAKGGLTANIGIAYLFSNIIEVDVILKNISNQTNLYPMNSNAGGPDVSSGTPAWESRTFWLTTRLKF